MQSLAMRLKTKQKQRTIDHTIFRNEEGAIDLASIMVGVIVIGLIGGVVSATVFGVIPWTQDKAAQQQLDSVVSAQSAYMGLSSAVPPAVPTGHTPNSYASSAQLEEANLLKAGPKYCTVTTDEGKGYMAFTKSDSNKIWTASDKKTAPEIFTGTLPTDCQFLAAEADPNDIDGDGIPNDLDRDADGDGVQDGYIPGGPIATLVGTSAPTSGTYNSALLTTSATTVISNISGPSTGASRKISIHFLVTCVKNDGSFYKRNFLSSYTPSSSSYNINISTVPCATNERIDEYTAKPVTQEALASGEISNVDSYGGWTFVFAAPAGGGLRWSEPDGYVKSGTVMSSYVTLSGSSVYVKVKNTSGTSRKLAAQYTMNCERTDKSTYSVNRILAYASRSGIIEETTVSITGCGSDRITSYEIFPVTKLGEAENKANFDTYSMEGTNSWAEARDGYQSSGTVLSSFVTNGGSAVYLKVKNTTGTSHKLAAQYTMECERTDKSTYSVNRILAYTSRSGIIEETTVSITGCGSDRITSYEIFPVTSLGEVENRENFEGYSMAGTISWREADGYQSSGTVISSYVTNGGSAVYLKVKNTTGTSHKLTSQYTMECEQPDKNTYSVNRLLSYTSRSGYIEETTVSITGCGTDRITAYEIFPVTSLGEVSNRESFEGYSMAGTISWKEADGYQSSGTVLSSSVVNNGTTIYVKVKNSTGTATTLASHYTLTCERPDNSTYSFNRLFSYNSRSGYIEETTLSITRCGTDRVIAYAFGPVTTLGEVENRETFMGYSMAGSHSWSVNPA